MSLQVSVHRGVYTPLGRHPPRQTPPGQITPGRTPPPPPRLPLQRTVRILLECIPVITGLGDQQWIFHITNVSHNLAMETEEVGELIFMDLEHPLHGGPDFGSPVGVNYITGLGF